MRLLNFEKNRGKTAVLNDAVPQLRGEIVAFSDASSMLSTDSIRTLVQRFSDPRTGAACGVYRLVKDDEARIGPQEDLYWKYETFLKVQEAQLGAFTRAHGASSCHPPRAVSVPIPRHDQRRLHDSQCASSQHGYLVAYEPAAVAYEEAHEMEGFSRRVRITAGNIEQMREIKRLLWPPRPFALFCLLSHKTSRLFVPLFMLIAFAANFALRSQFPYNWLLVGKYSSMVLPYCSLYSVFGRKSGLPIIFARTNSALFAWVYQALRHGRVIPSRVELDCNWRTSLPQPRRMIARLTQLQRKISSPNLGFCISVLEMNFLLV